MIEPNYTSLSLHSEDIDINIDITDATSDEVIDAIISMMRAKGYHEISMWRSLRDKADEMVEYFGSVISSAREFDE